VKVFTLDRYLRKYLLRCAHNTEELVQYTGSTIVSLIKPTDFLPF